MSEPLAYLNGRFLPQREAALPLYDAGFVFGATVTDLCRTFHHRPYRLDDHLARFRQSCQLAMIPQPLTDAELTEIATRIVAENARLLPAEADLALVMFATPGPLGYYLGQSGGASSPPTLGMHTFPLPFERYRRLFQEGARLLISSTRRHLPPAVLDPRIKHRNRLHWWLAEQEAHSLDPLASAFLLDGDDRVTETAAANFLLVEEGVIWSPPRSSILGGVSLRTVEELAAELGIAVRFRPLTVDDCLEAEEAMLCSTPYCLAGVSWIEDHAIPWPGSIFRRLLAAWNQRVGLDIVGQIDGFLPD